MKYTTIIKFQPETTSFKFERNYHAEIAMPDQTEVIYNGDALSRKMTITSAILKKIEINKRYLNRAFS